MSVPCSFFLAVTAREEEGPMDKMTVTWQIVGNGRGQGMKMSLVRMKMRATKGCEGMTKRVSPTRRKHGNS